MKKIICIIGIIVGIFVTYLGISYEPYNYVDYFGSDLYVNEQKKTYGGDAYTGIQNAAVESALASAETANNINALGETVSKGFNKTLNEINKINCLLLAFAGFSMVLISSYKLTDCFSKSKKKLTESPLPEESETSVSHNEEKNYKCPNCNNDISFNQSQCKNCLQVLDWTKVK